MLGMTSLVSSFASRILPPSSVYLAGRRDTRLTALGLASEAKNAISALLIFMLLNCILVFVPPVRSTNE